jgi:precorrin-6A/cobalt-precorrin-6A reductase
MEAEEKISPVNPPSFYLIGGTGVANAAAVRLLQSGFRVRISVLTGWGKELAGRATGSEVDAGAKESGELAARARASGAAAIIDCSHPFATGVSTQARLAAEQAELPYFRFCREPHDLSGSGAIVAGSWEEAVQTLAGLPGRSLLTVGTRHLEIFVKARIDFTARILPLAASLEECTRLGIDSQNVIAAQGPFDVDFNRACIRHARAATLVAKESGAEGGLPEKIEAAAAEGIRTIVIERPEDPGAIHDLEDLMAQLQAAL